MLPYPFDKKIRKLAIACCEAGAAQIISSFVKNHRFYEEIVFCLNEPAEAIFKNKIGEISIEKLDIINTLGKDDFVLAGRSLVPDFERIAIHLANVKGIDNGVFLDHWVNFDNFFIPMNAGNDFNAEAYMPMHIFAGDDYAFNMAKKLYGDKTVYIENEYFNDILKRSEQFMDTTHQGTLLFLTDPLSDDNQKLNNGSKLFHFDEFDVLDDLLKHTDILKKIGIDQILIRYHPNHSEEAFRLNVLDKIRYNKDLNVVIDGKTDLLEQIMSAQIIVGIESMGLVISQMVGKMTFSYVPEYGTKSIIFPHEKIKKIRDIREIPKELTP